MEMKNINEVNPNVEAEVENTKEWKKPVDIYLNTTDGIIVHEATSEKSFNKLYYNSMNDFKGGEAAKRIKNVKLPLNRERETFTNIHGLWDHLKANCGYKQL